MKTTPAYIRYTIVGVFLIVGAFYGLYQLTLTGNTDPSELTHIEEYLTLTGEVDAEVYAMAADLFAMAESGNYDMGRLTNILFQIEALKKELPTEHETFKALEQRSRQMLDTLRRLVLLIYEPSQTTHEERTNQWRQQANEFNRLSESRSQLVKDMLDMEGLAYNENADGSVSYWKP